MKAYLTYSYNPELSHECDRIKDIQNATQYKLAIEEFDREVLRPVVKYGCDDEAKEKVYEEIREKYWAVMRQYDIEV